MSYKLNIESEPFEFYSEFDENAETSEAEQADWEWEEEVRDHRHPHFPVPRSRTARHPVSPGRRMHSRYRHLVRDHRLPYRHRDHHWPYRHRWSAGYGSRAWPPYTAFPMYQPYPPWMGSYPADPVGAAAYAGRDERVLWLQEMLSRILGLQLPLNGIMGPEVQNAVRSFQQQQGLPATGIVDSATERALTAATKSTSSGEMEAFDVSEQELLPAGYYEMEEEFPARARPAFHPGAPGKTTTFRYVKNFSGPAEECTDALKKAGKTLAEALSIINAQIDVAIAMLLKAASALKRGNRSSLTRKLFLKIFRVTPEFVPTWLKTTDAIKDRGDVVATRCKRVAGLLASGTLRFFCKINTANCPDCAKASPISPACSSFGKDKVICLGDQFWDAMKTGNSDLLLATLMHEPFHIYYGQYVTEHDPSRGKFGGIYCIQRFVFEVNVHSAPQWLIDRCTNMVVRKEIGEFFA